MNAARLPLQWRDQCSASVPLPLPLPFHDFVYRPLTLMGARSLLIPLNRCRHKEFYLPWKCEDERHGYEKSVALSMSLPLPSPLGGRILIALTRCQYDEYVNTLRQLYCY